MKSVHLLLIGAAVLAAGCSRGSPVSPSLPSVLQPVGAVPMPVPTSEPTRPSTSSATLEVVAFEMRLQEVYRGFHWYRPTLVLAETGGATAATLQTLTFTMPGGSRFEIAGGNAPLGVGCLLTRESRIVLAGQQWNSSQVYTYCLDFDSYDIAGESVSVTVRFRDDKGGEGEVRGVTTAR